MLLLNVGCAVTAVVDIRSGCGVSIMCLGEMIGQRHEFFLCRGGFGLLDAEEYEFDMFVVETLCTLIYTAVFVVTI